MILCAVDFTVRQFLAPLALKLSERGLDVRVACTPGPHWEELQKRGLHMVPLRISRSWNLLSHLLSWLRLLFLLRRHRIEVLHVHTPVAALIGRTAAWIARVPVVIYTAHGFTFHDEMPRWKYGAHMLLERFGALFHDALCCVSEEDARTAEQVSIERPAHIYHTPNGVDPGRFYRPVSINSGNAVRSELGIPKDSPVVTITGRLTREKGFIEFLEAAELVAHENEAVRFLIVGERLRSDHDNIGKLLRQKAESGILADRVIFAGFRRDVPAVLAASTIFCLPSWREGMPVSILEAMMMELPVVATRVRGCREAVVDGSSGFLVEPRKARHIAGACLYLLEHPDTARKMGQAGRRRAEQLYRLDAALDRQWQVYSHLLGPRLR